MNRMGVLLAVLAFALAVGTGPAFGEDPVIGQRVFVHVDNKTGQITSPTAKDVVTTEPNEVVLFWVADPGYEFFQDGFVITDMQGKEKSHEHSCRLPADHRWIWCVKTAHTQAMQFKYTVTVINSQTQVKSNPVDPVILNH